MLSFNKYNEELLVKHPKKKFGLKKMYHNIFSIVGKLLRYDMPIVPQPILVSDIDNEKFPGDKYLLCVQ